MGPQFLLGIATILVTGSIHVAGLISLSIILSWLGPKVENVSPALRLAALLSFAISTILFLHTIEAWCWAGLYLSLGEFGSIERALYFSTVTITTLGYGDVTLSAQWALLGAFEAMEGMILFAASTAFLIAAFRHIVGDVSPD